MTMRLMLMLLLVWPVLVHAHDGVKEELSTLTVTGAGRLAIEPDTAFVTFGMETASKTLEEAQRANSHVMQRVAERLRGLQIEKERMQTSSFTVSPQYRPPAKRGGEVVPAPPEIIGYVVSNTLTVEVRNVEKVGAVIDESLAAGANRFQGVQWGLRDEQPVRLRVLKLAAGNAREKAAALGEALHVKLLRILTANEAGHIVRPASHAGRAMMAMDAGGSEAPMFAGEMSVEATISLVYEIGRE